MNKKIKERVRKTMEDSLKKRMIKDFPNLNYHKISTFYVNFLQTILGILTTIIIILTFSWYFPTMYGTKPETLMIVLLALIMLRTGEKTE